MLSLSKNDKETLCSLLIRLITCLNINTFFNFTNINIEDKTIDNILQKRCDFNYEIKNSLLLINDDELKEEDIAVISKENTVIKIHDGGTNGYYLNYPFSNIKINIYAKWFNINDLIVPDNFKVLAIIHVYNEEDIIEKTVNYLLSQGVDVYLLDNWSKDNTSSIINKLKEINPDRVFIEKYPIEKDNNCYDWYHQLERTEELSKTLDYDWFIHYDADEYRITPWHNITLREMIYFVDSLGFNLIENTVANFRVTSDKQENIFMKDSHFEFGSTSGCFVQYKTWKKSSSIDIKTSGGHIAEIENPKSFPLKILNRHYQFRSVDQALKKVLYDRKQRYRKEEVDMGWHVQYNNIKNSNDVIKNPSSLILWDQNTLDNYFIKLFITSNK